MKNYEVTIDMTWSQQIKVKAKTKAEAREKAWQKYCAKKPVKKYHTYYVDEI